MATEKWIAGSLAGLTWASAGFSTEVNSLANGNAVIAANQLDNSTALDVFADVSLSLGSVTPGSGAPYIGLYLCPLNQDGTTYGDGRFGSATSGPPAASYRVGAIPLVASTAGPLLGMVRGIILPPGKFKFLIHNQAGVTLAASSNTLQYRTYNRSVA
jgi:hypothetical protein